MFLKLEMENITVSIYMNSFEELEVWKLTSNPITQ